MIDLIVYFLHVLIEARGSKLVLIIGVHHWMRWRLIVTRPSFRVAAHLFPKT